MEINIQQIKEKTSTVNKAVVRGGEESLVTTSSLPVNRWEEL